MSLIDQIADVSVTATTSTQTRAGFGTMLIAAFKVPWSSGARMRTFGTLAAMVTAGFLTTDPAYQMAATAFAQDIAPKRVKVGRRTRAFTQVVHLIPAAPANDEVYTALVDGFTATYTGDGDATVAEVRTGLAAAINALADADAIVTSLASTTGEQELDGAELNGAVGARAMNPPRAITLTLSSHADWDATTAYVDGLDVAGNAILDSFAIPNGGNATVAGTLGLHFAKVTQVTIPAASGTGGTVTVGTRAPVTASVSGSNVVCTAPVAGELHSFELVTGNLTMADATTAPALADDLNELLAFDPDFYGLCLDSNSHAELLLASAWAETNKRFFCYQTADSACGDPSVTTDIMSVLKASARGYTHGDFFPAIAASDGWLAAGILGQHLPTTPGASTIAFKTIRNVTRRAVSDSFIAAIVTTPDSTGKNGNLYLDFAGVPGTFPGMMASGEWADVVRGLDDFRADVKARFLAIQTANAKVPFTDNGTDLFRAAVIASIKARITTGLFAASPVFTVTATPVAETSALDRSARRFNGITYSAPLAGAILYTRASGTATI